VATADPSATVSWFVLCIERLHDSGLFAVLVIVPDEVIVLTAWVARSTDT